MFTIAEAFGLMEFLSQRITSLKKKSHFRLVNLIMME